MGFQNKVLLLSLHFTCVSVSVHSLKFLECVFPALLHFSAFSFYGWALKTLGVVLILRSSLWDCCTTWSSQSAVLITNPWACLLLNLHQQKVPITLLDSYLSCSCALFTIHIPFGSSSFPSGFSSRSPFCRLSWLYSLLPLPFPQKCTFCLVWCRFGVWNPLSFAVRQKGVGFLQRGFSLCVSYLERKALILVETQEQHLLGGAKLSFALFASPSCSLDCCAPGCLFPGSGFLLDKPSAASSTMALHLSVPSMTLQQTPSLSEWDQSAALLSHLAVFKDVTLEP